MSRQRLLLSGVLLLISTLSHAGALYQCADGQFSDRPCPGGIKVDVPVTNTMPAAEPTPGLAHAETAAEPRRAKPEAPPIPLACRDLSIPQRQQIQQSLRFLQIVPCMTEAQAKQIIRNTQHTEILYPAGGNNMMKEWIFTPPTPRFPHRVLLENGYVVETQ